MYGLNATHAHVLDLSTAAAQACVISTAGMDDPTQHSHPKQSQANARLLGALI
jgi:hypothetical protein